MEEIALRDALKPTSLENQKRSFHGKLKGTKVLRIPSATCHLFGPSRKFHPDVIHEFLPKYTQAHTLGTCDNCLSNSNFVISPSFQLLTRLRVESD